MASPVTRKQLLGLLGWLAVCFAAAAAGGFASASAGDFYRQLVRPEWAPPAWLFGPAWTVLYLLMAVAAWLVWRDGGFRRRGVALTLFLVQLAINALWTWLFFVWRLGALAFGEIVLLWAWEGLPPRDIAVAMGLSANAVSIRLHRVKQRLADAAVPH